MAGLRVGRSVGVLLPWGVIAGVVPWPLGTQRPLATPALTAKIFTSSFLFPCMKNLTLFVSLGYVRSETRNLRYFFFVFRTQRGVYVPGVLSGDRGNYEKESLRYRSHACLKKA